MRRPRAARPHVDRSASAGFRFPPEAITLAVRCYLRYGLSYRDVEELLAERGIKVDHVTVYRWVQRVIDVLLSERRDTAAARRFFTRALRHGPVPVEVTTDQAGPYLRVIDDPGVLVARPAEVSNRPGSG